MCLSGKKRKRDFEDEDYWEELDSLRPRKKLKTEESGDSLVAPSPARKIIRMKRSNSQDRLGERLAIADRNTRQITLKSEDFKDYSVMAAFSREAFENFGKKWKASMSIDSLNQATKSSKLHVDLAETNTLLGLQSKVIVGTDFEAQVQALLEGKTNPHVIAVIEGKQEASNFSLKAKAGDDTVDAPYTMVKYLQGTNAKGSQDNKQSMSIYVRDDMKSTYTVTEELVPHLSTGKLIRSLGINYQTEGGTNYRTLAVHIPNEFIGTASKNLATHNSFEKYASDLRGAASPIVVTTYFGDTNYSAPMAEYSVASMGGHSSTGKTLNPQGSGAQSETHFMQSVPLGADSGKHSVLQPSTLNYLFINPDTTNREVTDHPSILQYVAHDNGLVGRQGQSSIEFMEAP